MTGVTISTRPSELTMPPNTGVASGFITSAPVEWLHMIGSRLATAGQAEGHGEEHLGGVEHRSIGQIEQHEDHDEHQWDDDLQALASPALVLVLAAPLDVRALGQRDALGDDPARLFDEAADVAPA